MYNIEYFRVFLCSLIDISFLKNNNNKTIHHNKIISFIVLSVLIYDSLSNNYT